MTLTTNHQRESCGAPVAVVLVGGKGKGRRRAERSVVVVRGGVEFGSFKTSGNTLAFGAYLDEEALLGRLLNMGVLTQPC